MRNSLVPRRPRFESAPGLAGRGVLILVVVLILLGLGAPGSASPPAMPKWRDPITAYNVFVHPPDKQGRFEVEFFCQANVAVEKIEIQIGHSEEISFESPLPRFEGGMRTGEIKRWRLKGKVRSSRDGFPASVVLSVRYLFPYEALVKDTNRRYARQTYDKETVLRRLKRRKGETLTVLKALPVVAPKSSQ